MQERAVKVEQTHRYYSTTHSMKAIAPILDGKYLQSATRQAPPKELGVAMGMPVSEAIGEAQQEEVNRD